VDVAATLLIIIITKMQGFLHSQGEFFSTLERCCRNLLFASVAVLEGV
jgi:hypothetical protein